jgi:hypothetical protein
METKLFVGILLLTTLAFGQPRACKTNPKVVGACYTVHGRATFGPGTPALRIWPVGTKRMLGVTAGPRADDADNPICPKEMLQFIMGNEVVLAISRFVRLCRREKAQCRWFVCSLQRTSS